LKRLSDLGDQLEAFRVAVDFETLAQDDRAASLLWERSGALAGLKA
jgi:hypothetical protein